VTVAVHDVMFIHDLVLTSVQSRDTVTETTVRPIADLLIVIAGLPHARHTAVPVVTSECGCWRFSKKVFKEGFNKGLMLMCSFFI
jgi:hypothetical protein